MVRDDPTQARKATEDIASFSSLTASAGPERRLKERGGDDTAGTRTAAATESAGEPVNVTFFDPLFVTPICLKAVSILGNCM
jgi:hypothetical protein